MAPSSLNGKFKALALAGVLSMAPSFLFAANDSAVQTNAPQVEQSEKKWIIERFHPSEKYPSAKWMAVDLSEKQPVLRVFGSPDVLRNVIVFAHQKQKTLSRFFDGQLEFPIIYYPVEGENIGGIIPYVKGSEYIDPLNGDKKTSIMTLKEFEDSLARYAFQCRDDFGITFSHQVSAAPGNSVALAAATP